MFLDVQLNRLGVCKANASKQPDQGLHDKGDRLGLLLLEEGIGLLEGVRSDLSLSLVNTLLGLLELGLSLLKDLFFLVYLGLQVLDLFPEGGNTFLIVGLLVLTLFNTGLLELEGLL